MQARSIAAWRNVADGMFEQDTEQIPINGRSRRVSHSLRPGGRDNARGGRTFRLGIAWRWGSSRSGNIELLHRRGLPRKAKVKIVHHKDERFDLAALIAPG